MFLFFKQHLALSFESIVDLLSKFRVLRKISSEISTVVAEPGGKLVNCIGAALFLCHFVSVGGVFLFTIGITAQALVILTFNDYQLVADTTVSDFFSKPLLDGI